MLEQKRDRKRSQPKETSRVFKLFLPKRSTTVLTNGFCSISTLVWSFHDYYINAQIFIDDRELSNTVCVFRASGGVRAVNTSLFPVQETNQWVLRFNGNPAVFSVLPHR